MIIDNLTSWLDERERRWKEYLEIEEYIKARKARELERQANIESETQMNYASPKPEPTDRLEFSVPEENWQRDCESDLDYEANRTYEQEMCS